jgi:hypothetical protein
MPHSGAPKAWNLTAKAPTERSSFRDARRLRTLSERSSTQKKKGHQLEVKQATNAVRDAMRTTQRLAKQFIKTLATASKPVVFLRDVEGRQMNGG